MSQPKEEQPQPQEVAEDQDSVTAHPGVVILKVVGPDNDVRVEIGEINGIDSFSVPSLLRRAAKLAEERLGI